MIVNFNNDVTKLAVIGSPIEHSLSPLIQNFMIDSLGLNYIYLPFHVAKGDATKFLDACSVMNIKGFNVTMPHKEDIFLSVKKVHGDAIESRSVNTANFKDGVWHGYSTDSEGFNLSINEHNIYLKDKNILILGAGGASRAVLLSADNNFAKSICILNRNLEKAKDISKDIKNIQDININNFTYKNISDEFKKADIIINTTPIGMAGINEDFSSFDFMDTTEKVVCDLIYNPRQTKFLKNAKEKGHLTINGLSMLIYQAILSLEIFTGEKIDKIEMKKRVDNFLKC